MSLKHPSSHILAPGLLIASLCVPQLVLAHETSSTTLPTETTPVFVNGLIVQGYGSPRVYYIQNGQKRWIASEKAFLAQGFRWSDVNMVDSAQLSGYADGADMSETSEGIKAESLMLPDLAPVAPYDLRIVTEEGRTRLRFTSTFWNRGKGELQLYAQAPDLKPAADASFPAFQHIFRPDGSYIDRPVGTLFWHKIHDHYHYDNFGRYVLEMIKPAAGSTVTPPVLTTKTTFCMRDDLAIGAPSDGPKQPNKYGGCDGHEQGVSVGWADVYPSTLPDQFVDITGLPAGTYKLSFYVDSVHFSETRRDNNVSATIIELNPAQKTFQTTAVASAYQSPNNRFPDGMLIKGENDPRVYVMNRNKKHWIRTEAAFLSYGYSWGNIITLPFGTVDALPLDKLVRVKGTGTIYVINEAGYRRRILNPEILTSYGWAPGDISDINETELGTYPPTDLMLLSGTDNVYSISARKYVGKHDELKNIGLETASVHAVNATDFNAHAVSVVANGLDVPWDIVFLPDGDMLVTQRSGTVQRIGKQNATITIPSVHEVGEGGLMGIALHPNFADNKFVYLYYTSAEGGTKNRIARFRLEGNTMIEDKIIVDNIPAAIYHDGGQLAFGPDGMLYATIGDANTSANGQNLSTLAGKTLRLKDDGGIPSDNPFGDAVWSYGHRNSQGIAWDAAGRMWQTEHGRSGALSGYDELNRVEKGKNYGWPTIQGPETRAGMELSVYNSGPSVTWAPSGLAFADGRLFFAGLKGASLYEATIGADGKVARFRSYFGNTYGRLRAVVLGPDGYLYITTSNRDGRGTPKAGDDKILRVSPDFLR
jgi:glucose/arabinose dehydrogenase